MTASAPKKSAELAARRTTKIGAAGFEPATSASQTQHSNQAELRPAVRRLPVYVRAMVQPRPALGYVMVAVAATLFAVNGTVSKVILGSGIGSEQLTEVRCAGALDRAGADRRRRRARARCDVRLGDLPLLIALGIGARARAVVLLLRDPPPRHRDRAADPVRRPDPRRALGALRLPRTRAPAYLGRARGLARRPHADRRDLARRPPERAGVAACIVAAITYAAYVLIAERGVRRRDPISLSAWGFLFATLFWTLAGTVVELPG